MASALRNIGSREEQAAPFDWITCLRIRKESLEMTREEPIQVIVAAFPTEQGAKEALHDLDEAKKQGVIGIKDAAVLMRDQDQKLHITETADKGFGRGAAIGGVAGAAVGILAGPIGWAALGGAAVGGL